MGRIYLAATLTCLGWAMTGSKAAGQLLGLLLVGGAVAVLAAFFIRSAGGSPR